MPDKTLDQISLDQTIAAPLPDVTLDAALVQGPDALQSSSALAARHSVLPRLERRGEALHMGPAAGPRYADVRPLGRGGMGEVALVDDRDIDRQVAIKRLLPEARHPGVVARFVDEVRTIGRLEHPNIVPIHDVGVDAEGRYFFVMKFVDGETLESVIDRLRRGDPEAITRYDVPRRVEIFEGLLRALQFAHSRGVLHRDVKPANIMVGRFGEVVLMDWGIACRTAEAGRGAADRAPAPTEAASAGGTLGERLSSTQDGAVVGTPHYMSPEQAKGAGQPLDVRSDLYAACVVFHELLGLRHRHADAKSVMAVLIAVMKAEAPSSVGMFEAHPSQPDGVPPEFAHFLHRGLQRAPEDRWQSAEQMLAELHAIGAGRCRVQCPVTFSKRVVTGLERFLDRTHIWGVMALGAGVLGLVALAGVGAARLLSGS
jgi:serine/threonine protein kinase